MKKTLILALLFGILILAIPGGVMAFGQSTDGNTYGAHGFFFGVWHGLLAPWTLIARLFIDDVVMYFSPNTGFGYDIGYLIGMTVSIPAGWVAALISIAMHIWVY